MEQMKILFLKFLTITVTIFVIFGAANYIGYDLLWIGVLTTAVSYAIGDLLLLPRLIGASAILADFGLGVVSVWLLGGFFIDADIPILTLSIISAILFTAVEPFVHTYLLKFWKQKESEADELVKEDEVMARLGYRQSDDLPTIRSRYVTEFAQEWPVDDLDHDYYKEQERHKSQFEKNVE